MSRMHGAGTLRAVGCTRWDTVHVNASPPQRRVGGACACVMVGLGERVVRVVCACVRVCREQLCVCVASSS